MIIGAAALGATAAIILTQIGPENSVSPTLP
jgi:hypothetical protein